MEIKGVYFGLCEKNTSEPSSERFFIINHHQNPITRELDTLLTAYLQKVIEFGRSKNVTEESFGGEIREIDHSDPKLKKISIKTIFEDLIQHCDDPSKFENYLTQYGYVLGKKYIKIENSRTGLLFLVVFSLNAGYYISCIRTDLTEKQEMYFFDKKNKNIEETVLELILPQVRALSKAGLYPSIIGGKTKPNRIKIIQKAGSAEYIRKFFEIESYLHPYDESEWFFKTIRESNLDQEPIRVNELKTEYENLRSNEYSPQEYEEHLVQQYPTKFSKNKVATFSKKRKALRDNLPKTNKKSYDKTRIALRILDTRFLFDMDNLEETVFLAEKGEYKYLIIKDTSVDVESFYDNQKLNVEFSTLDEVLKKLDE